MYTVHQLNPTDQATMVIVGLVCLYTDNQSAVSLHNWQQNCPNAAEVANILTLVLYKVAAILF